MAGLPLPRRTLNQPAFREAVRASGVRGWQIAIEAGIPHHSKFSALVNAESVADTTTNIKQLRSIADAVGFDKSKLFLDGEDR